MGIKHLFTSAKADGADATVVQPSDWNADHTVDDLVTTGKTALQGDISPAQLTANTDDWAPTGLASASIIRLSTDASRNITGLTGGEDGRIIVLANIGSFDAVLVHDATSTAANRFLCPGSANFTLGPGDTVPIVYDSTSSRWRVADSSARMNAHIAAADPHTGYATDSDLSTHAGAADPHTGYRLESADHSHASTGLQGGQLDHGTALTGLGDDDHPQYRLESESGTFSVGGTLLSPVTGQTIMVWRAPFACTVTAVRGHFKGGTSVVYNAQVNQASKFASADKTMSTANAWDAATANQNLSLSAGDDIEIMFITVNGAVTEATIQVDLTRP